eukprot:366525-Chlamydomonas_euryale.AAC.14
MPTCLTKHPHTLRTHHTIHAPPYCPHRAHPALPCRTAGAAGVCRPLGRGARHRVPIVGGGPVEAGRGGKGRPRRRAQHAGDGAGGAR